MAKANKKETPIKGFVGFIREQGVVGLAIGVVIGVAAKDTVDALVTGIINPLVGILLPSDNLSKSTVVLGGAEFAWGAVASAFINLAVVAAVVYFGAKALKLEKLDKKK